MNEKKLSTLSKTWIFDLDGTLVEHNGYKTTERLLPGVAEFYEDNIKDNDVIILMTARNDFQSLSAIKILKENNLRYDLLISNLPHGERIIFNDKKNSGLKTCHSINLYRNEGLINLKFTYSKIT
jgi:hypothetical protein